MKNVLPVHALTDRNARSFHSPELHRVIAEHSLLSVIHLKGSSVTLKCACTLRWGSLSHGYRRHDLHAGSKNIHIPSSVIGELRNLPFTAAGTHHQNLGI